MFHHIHGWGFAPSLMHFFHTYRLGGLFLLLLIEEAGVPIPIPGDMLVAVAGAQQHMTVYYVIRVLTTATLAVFLGSSLLYWVIRRGGRPLFLKLARYMHVRPERLDRLEGWFVQYGAAAIIVGRLIPGLRVPTAVMAGLTNVPYRIYGPASAFAALVWSACFFWLGGLVQPYMGVLTAFGLGLLDSAEDSILLTLLIVALLAVAIAWGWRITHVRRKRANSAALAAQDAQEAQEAQETHPGREDEAAPRNIPSQPAHNAIGNPS